MIARLTFCAFALLTVSLLVVPGVSETGVLTIQCGRTGGLYAAGERASFIVQKKSGRLSLRVVDFYGENVVEEQPPGEESGCAVIVLDTGRLPRLGWHKITVSAANGAASTTFAVVPPRKDLVAVEESPFGAIVSPRLKANQIADFAHSLKLAGVRWVDIDLPLAQLNPSEGQYVWDAPVGSLDRGNFDSFVRVVHKEGMCLMLKFLGQADWISKRKDKEVHAYWDSELNLSAPSDPKEWAEVVAAVVKRYGEICRTWEIGNEPEGHGYFKGSDEEYMEYLETTARAIRAVQPNATIVAASMYNGGGVLPRLVKRPDLYDIMSVHYLTGPFGDISPLSHYQKALDAAGVKKVIWNTESRGSGGDEPPKPGEASHFGANGAHNQSPTKAYVRNFALGVPRVFVFSWNVGEGRQVVNADYSPRWATVEYRTMVDQLEGVRFVREVNLGKDLSGFQFRRGGDNILVAWSDLASYEAVVTLRASTKLVVIDIMGNSTEGPVRDGVATIRISYQPAFVRGLGADLDVQRVAWTSTP